MTGQSGVPSGVLYIPELLSRLLLLCYAGLGISRRGRGEVIHLCTDNYILKVVSQNQLQGSPSALRCCLEAFGRIHWIFGLPLSGEANLPSQAHTCTRTLEILNSTRPFRMGPFFSTRLYPFFKRNWPWDCEDHKEII